MNAFYEFESRFTGVKQAENGLEPLPVVVKALHQGKTYKEVADSLPDIEPAMANKSMLLDSLAFIRSRDEF